MTDVILLDAPDTHTKKRQVICDMIQTAAKHYGREEREGVREELEFCDFLSHKAATHGKQNTSAMGQKGPWGSFWNCSAELHLTHKEGVGGTKKENKKYKVCAFKSQHVALNAL